MLNYVRGLYPLGRGNVGCCCILGSEVKLRFYFWCYVYVQYMTNSYLSSIHNKSTSTTSSHSPLVLSVVFHYFRCLCSISQFTTSQPSFTISHFFNNIQYTFYSFIDLCVNISERKSGTKRLKKHKFLMKRQSRQC